MKHQIQSAPSLACLPSSPSGRGFIALLEAFRATGGTAPGEIVARLLEERQVGAAPRLAQLAESGQIFGLEWRSSLWIPMFQFKADDLALKPASQSVREELPSWWSGWDLACWFAQGNEGLDGRRPVDLLDTELAAVLRAAQALQHGSSFSSIPRAWQEIASTSRGRAMVL